MSASSALASEENIAVASLRHDVGDAMSVGDAGVSLGISDACARALAIAGLLGAAEAPTRFKRAAIENLAERLWRAALPTASDVRGVRLRDAVEADGDPEMWPEAVVTLLDGRVNAFC